jgi:hypothetical protein
MSRTSTRTAAVALLASAGLVALAGPAAAIPFEGGPDSSARVHVVALPDAAQAGSTLFVSHGYAAVLDGVTESDVDPRVVLLTARRSLLADPPALNRDDCAAALASVANWPGTFDDGVRLVSDAYDHHISRSDDCASDLSTR